MFSISNAIIRPSLALAPKNSYYHQQHINKNAFSAVQFMFSNRDCHVNNAWYRDRTLCSSCKRVCVIIPLYASCLCNHVLLHLHHVFYCQIIHAVSMLISIALFFFSNYSDKWYLSYWYLNSNRTCSLHCSCHSDVALNFLTVAFRKFHVFQMLTQSHRSHSRKHMETMIVPSTDEFAMCHHFTLFTVLKLPFYQVELQWTGWLQRYFIS